MSTSREEAIAAYLVQLQPHDLADMMSHAKHDMSSLVDSYASDFEQLELQLETVALSPDIALNYSLGLKEGIAKLQDLLDRYPDFHQLPSTDASLATEWLHTVVHDLRSPIGILMGWTELLQLDFSLMPASPLRDHIQHLAKSMQSTAERMYLITAACYEFRRSETQQ